MNSFSPINFVSIFVSTLISIFIATFVIDDLKAQSKQMSNELADIIRSAAHISADVSNSRILRMLQMLISASLSVVLSIFLDFHHGLIDIPIYIMLAVFLYKSASFAFYLLVHIWVDWIFGLLDLVTYFYPVVSYVRGKESKENDSQLIYWMLFILVYFLSTFGFLVYKCST